MTAPAQHFDARQSALPAPDSVITDGPVSPETTTGARWWEQYGGTLDKASGVIAFPPPSLPPCPFPCSLCEGRR